MGELRNNQRARVAVVAVLAVAVAVIGYLLISGEDDGRGADGPRIVTADELQEIADDLGHPIYWAGERSGTRLEYERRDDDLVYVRYLTGEAEAGDSRNSFLAIGTYPRVNALAGLKEVAGRPDHVRHELPNGGMVVVNTNSPTSAYLANPDADEQVEIYDPDPATAIGVAISGDVVPLD